VGKVVAERKHDTVVLPNDMCLAALVSGNYF